MAKIRAYKIAEELGLDRNELVEKAATLGIELKSAMATLEDAEVELLREKLGVVRKGEMEERRVEGKDGAAVIRRRKVAAPPPAPEPVPAPVVEPTTLAAHPASESLVAAGLELVPEPAVVAPVVAAGPDPVAAPRRAEPAAPAVRARQPEPAAVGPEAERGKLRKQFREVVNLREQEQIARQATSRPAQRRQVTLDPRGTVSSPRRKRRDVGAPAARGAAPAQARPGRRVVRIENTISVAELARQLGVKAAEVQGKLMALGTMVSITQLIDAETAGRVAAQLGFDTQDVGFREEEFLVAPDAAEPANLAPRPPVITVMGHVDHGKTSLLDALRKTKVAAGEAGGITQHIGAYQVSLSGKKFTFIDTPGHAAFTAMRARGAKVTDIVVLVVAATEGVMPQTVEAIDHARAAGVPIVLAVNKCDLPGANPAQIRQRIMEHGLVTEEFGGEIQTADISAKAGTGLDVLLEKIGLQAEILDLKTDPARRAAGVVLEARLDKGRGPVATVLVQEGTLRRGDIVVVGTTSGRVRAMLSEAGEELKEAGPSTPVQVIGLSAVPEAGQLVNAVESERVARDIAAHREAMLREKPAEVRPKLSLEEFFARQEDGGVKELRVMLKADTQGSVEAAREALLGLSTDRVKVNVIHAGAGAINESDVMLSHASDAIAVGFHVRPDPAARRAAEDHGVDVRHYQVIYELVDEVRRAMAGLLPPTLKERVLGRAEVRKVFVIPKLGPIAGCYVTEGPIRRGAQCRLLRDGVQVYQGRIASLRRFKDDAREVQAGFECGIGIEGYSDVKLGDVIEAFEVQEEPAEL